MPFRRASEKTANIKKTKNMALLLFIFVALPTALAIPLPQQGNGPPFPDSFQEFANSHLTPPPVLIDDGGPVGFNIQLGHNSTVNPGQTYQLSNYYGVIRGLHATGPLAFEAYNGSYCPPFRGYYYMGATVHLITSVVDADSATRKNETVTPQVTVSVCLFGFCNNDSVASLDFISSTSGLHTVSVAGLLSLKDNDRLVLQVKTSSSTSATILNHSSFMGFLWSRYQSQQ